MISKVLATLILFSSTLNLEHKFYVSTTDVKFNTESNTLQITMKLFTDDIEKAIDDLGNKKSFLGSEKESKEVNDLMSGYILKNFILNAKNQDISLKFIGKEVEQDYTWIYLESNKIDSPKRIEIKNTILIDYFEDQNNKVNFENGRISNSNSFHKDKTEGFIPQ